MTGDDVYFQRAEKELLNVCNFQDWNPSHFLDVAEMTLGVSIGYDWLFHQLPAESRNIIEQAIIKKALLPSLNDKYNWYLEAKHNWNQVCNAGITFGALAVYEQDTVLCKKLIDRAIQSIKLPMLEYAPDGAYPEGYSYWQYGTTFNILLLDVLEKIYGTDFKLSSSKGFMDTAAYFQHMTGASGNSFNYADCGKEFKLTPAIFWFAWKRKDPSLLWVEKGFIQSQYADSYLTNRLLPSVLIWGIKTDMESVNSPHELMWIGGGTTPVFSARSSWGDPDAIFVGFKGGTASSNHAHMDAGSFVMEADGIRWAIDLGMQDYESLESRKLHIWKNNQESDRWKVFRYNNYVHNTLTINDKLHDVTGHASFISYKNDIDYVSATGDLSSIFKDDLKSCMREIAIVNKEYVQVKDKVSILNDKQAILRWTMLTKAHVKDIYDNRLILEQDGKLLLIEFTGELPVKIKTWDTQSPNEYDAPNTGTILVGFESNIPAGMEVEFKAFLRPVSLVNNPINIKN